MFVHLKYIGFTLETRSQRRCNVSLFWEMVNYFNFFSDFNGARWQSLVLFKQRTWFHWIIHAGLVSLKVRLWPTRKIHEVGIPLPGKKNRLKREAERNMTDRDRFMALKARVDNKEV